MAKHRAGELRVALDQVVAGMSAGVDPLELLDDITTVESFAVELATERVASARAAGATWDDVARRLGVSRQAAHKRFSIRRRGVRLALRIER